MIDCVNRLYIYSVPKEFLTKESDYLDAIGFPFEVGEGKYKGEVEDCIVVQGGPGTDVFIKERVTKYGEEAYIIVYYDKAVRIVYKDGTSSIVGTWVETLVPSGDYTKLQKGYFEVR